MRPGGCTPRASRNDQVATDFRLYVRDAIDTLLAQVKVLQLALVERADAEAETIMPGFTHLQSAQPVTFGHHLLAYVEMLGRDAGRLADARTRLNEIAARFGGAGGHALSDRSRDDGEGARLRPADGELARCRQRPRLHHRDAERRRHHGDAPFAASPKSW